MQGRRGYVSGGAGAGRYVLGGAGELGMGTIEILVDIHEGAQETKYILKQW